MPAATEATIRLNAQVLAALDFTDTEDFDDAQRGYVGSIDGATVLNPKGRPVWSMAPYGFLDADEAPATVNPSLWRQARLNRLHGLFKVTDRIWQVRGLDIANITLIEGDSGLIVIDPLTFVEAAKAALELYYAHRPRRPVIAVIYSHSHVDHYGGALGVASAADVAEGRVKVIAPSGFMQAAVSENVLAGVPMRRRAQFQFGNTLAPGAQSHVDSGLGKGIGRGTTSLLPPTMTIDAPRERHVIDGVEIVFQFTPDSEAPAEMHFFFPQLRALNLAENATHNMHNLCPLRGAQARDALAWSKYLNEALEAFVPEVEVMNHLVFADPGHRAARDLAADAMEQLGYQCESSTWRNAYLLGARELREGVRTLATGGAGALAANVVSVLPMEMFFDYLAIRVDGIKAQDIVARFDWEVPDAAETWKLTLVNGVLHHSRGSHGASADASLRIERAALARILGQAGGLEKAFADGAIAVTGNRALIGEFLAVLEEFDPNFNVVEP